MARRHRLRSPQLSRSSLGFFLGCLRGNIGLEPSHSHPRVSPKRPEGHANPTPRPPWRCLPRVDCTWSWIWGTPASAQGQSLAPRLRSTKHRQPPLAGYPGYLPRCRLLQIITDLGGFLPASSCKRDLPALGSVTELSGLSQATQHVINPPNDPSVSINLTWEMFTAQ